ncbi:MAG: DUF2007 domain-containing protein [Candidatus Neomarinimicrobiota bacterium]|nr:DUF2007 domain-containing protein [Candidatus Neomarinimicrobiota bacterium]
MNSLVEFKHLYFAANSTEAHLIKGLLESDGISTILFGEDLSIGVGELPVDVLQVGIKVDKKKHVKALEIISNYEKNNEINDKKHIWTCTNCNSINPKNFEICWSCQTES